LSAGKRQIITYALSAFSDVHHFTWTWMMTDSKFSSGWHWSPLSTCLYSSPWIALLQRIMNCIFQRLN